MKHLKQYNSYREVIDFTSVAPYSILETTDSDKEYLDINLPEFNVMKNSSSKCIIVFLNKIPGHVMVNKIKDEWFLLTVYTNNNRTSKYYICDQISGVVDCIKNIKQKINESTQSDFNHYYKISDSESKGLSSSKHILFDDKIQEKIKKALSITTFSIERNQTCHHYVRRETDEQDMYLGFMDIRLINLETNFYIHHLEDEWFLLVMSFDASKILMQGRRNIERRYFKCDQIEGLLECIKDQIFYMQILMKKQ